MYSPCIRVQVVFFSFFEGVEWRQNGVYDGSAVKLAHHGGSCEAVAGARKGWDGPELLPLELNSVSAIDLASSPVPSVGGISRLSAVVCHHSSISREGWLCHGIAGQGKKPSSKCHRLDHGLKMGLGGLKGSRWKLQMWKMECMPWCDWERLLSGMVCVGVWWGRTYGFSSSSQLRAQLHRRSASSEICAQSCFRRRVIGDPPRS